MRSRPTWWRGRWLAVAVLVAAGGLLGVMVGLEDRDSSVPVPAITSDGDERAADGDAQGSSRPVDDAPNPDELVPSADAEGSDDEPLARPQPIGDPLRVEIPAIAVDAEIVPVGLKPDGAMEVPDFGLAGWYTEGPRPGGEGPSTVIAHVDSKSGPDVFARLRELEPGDEVRIHGEDGTVTYVAEASERAPKDELPAERIWGWTEEPTLRLITCDGLFDRSIGHYEDNLIVYLSISDG